METYQMLQFVPETGFLLESIPLWSWLAPAQGSLSEPSPAVPSFLGTIRCTQSLSHRGTCKLPLEEDSSEVDHEWIIFNK